MDDTISRADAIEQIQVWAVNLANPKMLSREDAIYILETMPSAQLETCEGCKHLGKWENEVEYGYPSPCTSCKRRVNDHYER